MFKSIALAEIESETKRMHRYECPLDTPPEEAYHILGMIRANVFDQMKAIEEAEAKQKAEEKAKAKEIEEKVESCEKVEPAEVVPEVV